MKKIPTLFVRDMKTRLVTPGDLHPTTMIGGHPSMGNSTTRTTLHKLLDDLRDEQARTDVMRRALLVYAVALDAHERGDRLAVVGMDGAVVHEVVGIEGAVG